IFSWPTVPKPIIYLFKPLIWFLIWSVCGALMVPKLLEGSVVVFPYGSLGSGILHPTSNNIIHSAYLIMCVGITILVAISINNNGYSYALGLIRWYRIAGWLAIAFIFWEILHT